MSNDIKPIEHRQSDQINDIGIGIFLLTVGLLWFAEGAGWIPKFQWFLQIAMIVLGSVFVARAIKRN